MTRTPLGLDLVRRASRLLWSSRTSDPAARATIRALGAGFGATRPDAASPLETVWGELAQAASRSDADDRLARLAQSGARPYAVIGDSHGRLLVRRARDRDGRWLAPLWWLETGASARGLGRVGARSGAGERVGVAIRRALAVSEAPILLKFGQVDVEFVQVFKRLEQGQTAFDPSAFKTFADETVARYVDFLTDVVASDDRSRVRLCSLFPPALSDAAWRRGYFNAHIADLHGPADGGDLAERLSGFEIPDLRSRTALHADVNATLAAAGRAEGFAILDDFTPLLAAGGVADPRYLGASAGSDHHLDFHATRAQVVDQLWRLLAGSPGNSRTA